MLIELLTGLLRRSDRTKAVSPRPRACEIIHVDFALERGGWRIDPKARTLKDASGLIVEKVQGHDRQWNLSVRFPTSNLHAVTVVCPIDVAQARRRERQRIAEQWKRCSVACEEDAKRMREQYADVTEVQERSWSIWPWGR
jgi:hypothetical protein